MNININKTIFTEEFQNISQDQINSDIKKNGYFAFEKAFTDDAVAAIEKDATKARLNLNNIEMTGVYSNQQYYLTNLLAVSKSFYDLATSKFVMNICSKNLGDKFRLKALRYYETYGGHNMQWHTDNKTTDGFMKIPGLIFIFYVSNVENGQFQYINGSHIWSTDEGVSDYSDKFINKNYKKDIVDFIMPKGSLIIYNTYGIHRAKPVKDKNFIRKSVFFQVDSQIQDSEPIILRTKYMDNLDDQVSMFLGLGMPAEYPVFPKTSIETLPFNKNILNILIKYIFSRIRIRFLALVPDSFKDAIKNIIN